MCLKSVLSSHAGFQSIASALSLRGISFMQSHPRTFSESFRSWMWMCEFVKKWHENNEGLCNCKGLEA